MLGRRHGGQSASRQLSLSGQRVLGDAESECVRVQVEAAAFSVHSPIYTDNKALEREGDAKLRGYFHDRMMDVLVNRGFKVRHATTT